MRLRNRSTEKKVELQMTSMIDIVFQLLVFFIMTFKIVTLEGDFNVEMPLAASVASTDNVTPPMVVRLEAGSQGELTNVRLNEFHFGDDLNALQAKIVEIIGDERGPTAIQDSPEVKFDIDSGLKYHYTIQAITAVTGYKSDGETVKLIERIKFESPRS